MKHTKSFLFLLIALILLGNSCSSLPGKKETRSLDVKNKAAGYQKDGITQFNAGRYEQALDLFDLAYQLNASVDNEEGLVLTLNSIGKTKLADTNKEEAFESFSIALAIAERLKDELLIMLTKGNIADYYIKEDETDSAYSLLTEELNKIEGIKSEESAYLAHNLSLVLRKQKKYDEALVYLNRSLEYNFKNDAFRALAGDFYMKASIYSLQANYAEALLFALEALQYDKMIEYPQGIAADLDALSIISLKMGNESESEIYRKRSAVVLEAIGNINNIESEKIELDDNQDQ
jgi:tetratricopeptide (TPR) repeat protein